MLAASGDSGAADVGLDGSTYYTFPDHGLAAERPAGHRRRRDPAAPGRDGNHTSPDTVWNDTYSVATNQFIFGDNGPNPLATGGGKSVLFARPSYQALVRTWSARSRACPTSR